MIQKITKADLIEANKRAVEGGYLAALAHERGELEDDDCQYWYPEQVNGHNCGCAIGVALDSDVIDQCAENLSLNGQGVPTLHDRGLVDFGKDFEFACKLQAAHDRWINAIRSDNRAEGRRGYIELTGITIAKSA